MTKSCFSLPLLLLIAFSTLTLTSCGEDCDFDQEDYVGSYQVTEACSLTSATAYNVSISAGAAESEVKITNFWDLFNNPVYATLNCETITIARQDWPGFASVGSSSPGLEADWREEFSIWLIGHSKARVRIAS